jgi:molecular chaperone GrpE
MTGRSKKYENEIIEESELNETEIQSDEENFQADETPSVSDNCDEKIRSLENEIFDYRDKLVRKAAEFENYKKRTSEEFVRIISTANEDLIMKILPVIDDIERFEKKL